MDAASDQQATKSCNIDSSTNSNGSLTWYQLTINGVAMYLFARNERRRIERKYAKSNQYAILI
jgi:hypothetical protein